MAEAELNALKKLESNKSCVNCGAYNKFGHGNVCEKFKTFVCSNCKSAHQSFSHRVKSVTMSNWSQSDVDALKDEHGGGNAAATRVWLGHWDEARLRKPRDGDHVDVYKRFIDKVYNDRAFYDDDAAANPSAGGASSSASRRANPNSGSSRRVTEEAAPNLLDFGSPVTTSAPVAAAAVPTFDAFGSPPKGSSHDGWGAFASAPAPASTSSNDAFGAFTSAPPAAAPFVASFDAFGAAPAPAPVASTPAASFDPFGPSRATPAVSPPSTNFDPFGSSATTHAPSSSSNFGFGAAPAAPPPMMAPASRNFSAFDSLAAPPPNMAMGGMGMHSGMPRGPGMMPPMGMNMGMPHHPPQGMMGGFGGAPQPMAHGNFMGAPPAAFNGGVRPLGPSSSGSRDPFAGLGLPHK